jgi:thiol:disulfide interchange protein
MKILILLFISALVLFANGLQFEHNFDKALQKAKEQNKEVMMMYSATWCPECNYMKEVVFKNKKVSTYMENNFVVLLLDIQKDTLPKGFEYPGIPVFFFIDVNSKEKSKIIGGSKAKIFLQKLKAVK